MENAAAWTQATDEVRAAHQVGPLVGGATLRDLPADDRAFWDAVERRAIELGGRPAGPVA